MFLLALFTIGCLRSPAHTLTSVITITITPYYDHSFPIIADNKQIYMELMIPSGLLPLHLENLLDIYPVATSFLRSTVKTSSLSYSQLFIAGAFKILTHKAYNRTATTIMVSVERQFTIPLVLTIHSIQSTQFNSNDWCLAKYSSGWTCVGNLTETDTNVYGLIDLIHQLSSVGAFDWFVLSLLPSGGEKITVLDEVASSDCLALCLK